MPRAGPRQRREPSHPARGSRRHGRGSVRSSEYINTSWLRPSLKNAPRTVPSRLKPHFSAIRREAAVEHVILLFAPSSIAGHPADGHGSVAHALLLRQRELLGYAIMV